MIGRYRSIAYLVRLPKPMTIPSAGQVHRFCSNTAMTSRSVANAQKKNSGGSMVIR